jgi:signal transduction histidine kinase/DNA-binding response OmpR family regulator
MEPLKTETPVNRRRRASEFLSGGGDLGKEIRSRDWSKTPLGDPERWPHALKAVTRLMLNSRYAIWIGWGPHLTFLYNDAYARMTLGKKHPWALGRPAREVWAEAWDDLGPRVDEVVQHGRATYDENLLLLLERSGYPEETYHTFSYSPLLDDKGSVAGLLCIVVEDTDRYVAERRLKVLRDVAAEIAIARTEKALIEATEKSLEANQQDLPFTLVYLVEPDGQRWRMVSSTGFTTDGHLAAPLTIEAGQEKTAWPLASVTSDSDTIVLDDLSNRFSNLPRGAWDKAPRCAVMAPLFQHGQKHPAGVMVVGVNPYRPVDETYLGFIKLLAGQIAAGLSDVRAYEQEKKRAEALAEIDRAKTTFFSNVSHEFRTPLTLILSPLEEKLADSSNDGTVAFERDELELIHRNGLRLLKLVNTLLDFSRIEAGRVQATFEPTDLSSFTADLASSFRAAVERAGLNFEVSCQRLPELIYVDRDMWEKIVLNLISNAFKYTFRGHIAVSVRAKADHKNVELEVRDSGVGIPEHELSRIFERFHRIEGQVSRTQEGTGIGLALVQELVKLHGGSISVESALGKGSTFTVSIPAGSKHLPAERVLPEAAAASTRLRAQVFVEEALRWLGDTPQTVYSLDTQIETSLLLERDESGKKPLVLVADDNADMREYIRRLLSGRFDVRTFGAGRPLLEAARRNVPEAILSDVMMPVMDGFELLRELRADPDLQSIPVILLSARAGEESRIEGLSAGADEYLVKPFSGRELIARLEASVRMTHVRRENEQALRRAHDELQSRAAELARFNSVAVGREQRMIELKKEVNGLRSRLGEKDRYSLAVNENAPDGLNETYQAQFQPNAPLESILRTEELDWRPSRAPDYETENRALTSLAKSLAESPRTILQALVDKTLEVLRADSAGVSLLSKNGERFYWAAIAGQWSPHLGGGTPRDFGPCGDVLSCNRPLLFTRWERRYPYLAEATPLAEEGLLVPFYVRGQAVGTIWVIAHTPQRNFDAEDLRLLQSLGQFASAAYQAIEHLGAVEQSRAALNLLEDATEARQAVEAFNRKLVASEQRLLADAEALAKLNECSLRLWRCRNLTEGLEEMLDAVVELLGAEKGSVHLLDADGKLKIAAHRGFSKTFLDFFNGMSGESAFACARASKSGEQIIIEDVEQDVPYEPLRAWARAEGYRSVISSPLSAGDGNLLGVLSAHFPDTHRPENEDLCRLDLYIRQASDFIVRCKTEAALRNREQELREADRLKNEFLAVLGHELRNPLAPICNSGELLARTLDGHPQAKASVAVIQRQAGQLTRMVDDLLDVARITQGIIFLQKKTVDLSNVIAQAVEMVQPLLQEKQHQLSVVSGFQPLCVSGDAARLVQCVSNILTNAAKYTDTGGRIRVELRGESSVALIEVEDNGCGIPEDLLPRIFDLFVQGERSLDRAKGGLGIGLPVVKKLVEMHGGTISARSAGWGKGATFEIRLPRVATPEKNPQHSEWVSISRKRIFIVDDNVDAAETLASLLEMDGHEVRAVTSAKAALEHIESFRPDIALLDIGLPEINGYELLGRLRQKSALQNVRFIAVTGYGRTEDRERIHRAGFESHLIKPVSISALNKAMIGNSNGITG